jgi:hypothetical protein
MRRSLCRSGADVPTGVTWMPKGVHPRDTCREADDEYQAGNPQSRLP